MAALLMACCSAQAQNARMDEDPASDDAIELKTTYVRPEYVEIERLRETKEIIVIPKEDIVERGNRTISDVLEGVPGVSVNTSGNSNALKLFRAAAASFMVRAQRAA